MTTINPVQMYIISKGKLTWFKTKHAFNTAVMHLMIQRYRKEAIQ